MCGSLGLLWRYLTPPVLLRRQVLARVPKVDVPVDGALVLPRERVALLREGDSVYALALICTHLGCTVTVTSTGDNVVTVGDRSYGILAQSIGGTGGDGGFSVAGAISKSKAVTFSLGGGGGSGSTGGNVVLNSSSDVYTLGHDSHGLFAQSLGGSGGSGGFSVAGSISADNSAIAGVGISIGGFVGRTATVSIRPERAPAATAKR